MGSGGRCCIQTIPNNRSNLGYGLAYINHSQTTTRAWIDYDFIWQTIVYIITQDPCPPPWIHYWVWIFFFWKIFLRTVRLLLFQKFNGKYWVVLIMFFYFIPLSTKIKEIHWKGVIQVRHFLFFWQLFNWTWESESSACFSTFYVNGNLPPISEISSPNPSNFCYLVNNWVNLQSSIIWKVEVN